MKTYLTCVAVAGEALRILDRQMRWTVDPGDFEIRIGASSTDIRQKKRIKL